MVQCSYLSHIPSLKQNLLNHEYNAMIVMMKANLFYHNKINSAEQIQK